MQEHHFDAFVWCRFSLSSPGPVGTSSLRRWQRGLPTRQQGRLVSAPDECPAESAGRYREEWTTRKPTCRSLMTTNTLTMPTGTRPSGDRPGFRRLQLRFLPGRSRTGRSPAARLTTKHPDIPDTADRRRRISIVARDTTWKGDITAENSIHVYGRFEGTIDRPRRCLDCRRRRSRRHHHRPAGDRRRYRRWRRQRIQPLRSAAHRPGLRPMSLRRSRSSTRAPPSTAISRWRNGDSTRGIAVRPHQHR